MFKRILIPLLVIPLLIAACGGQETPLVASECTIDTPFGEAPPEFVELFAPTEDDWSFGPEDAELTIIEYGDYQ
jgi:hypothetical protein